MFLHRCRVGINISWLRKYDPFFNFHNANISHLIKKSWYQSIMQFLNQKQRKFFSVDVKNNLNMSCVDKSQTCVHHLPKIVNFTNCQLDYFCEQGRSGTQLFSFLGTRAILKKLNVHIFNNNLCICQVFKTRNVYMFYIWWVYPQKN